MTGILKIIGAVFLSFCVMSAVCFFFYKIPTTHLDPDGANDYKYSDNTLWFSAKEGYGYGKSNNDGYMNLQSWEEGDQIDTLIMGGSNIEAMQMPMEKSVTGKLNELMGSESAYNIGMSGHQFLGCVGNMEAALKKYRPHRFLIMETGEITFTDQEMKNLLEGCEQNEIPVVSGGIYDFFRENPFLRLISYNVKTYLGRLKESEKQEEKEITKDNKELYRELLIFISEKAAARNVQPIILYHPLLELNDLGELKENPDESDLKVFKELCESMGIYFLDMTDRFRRAYEENDILPYGFQNTAIGNGHLNQYGHEMMAEEIYRVITELETMEGR